MGTPYYMSPEQAEGKREVDHRTDLWALGVIASECLTGVRPFDGQTFGELLLNICARPAPVPSTLAVVPRYFDAWFAKATDREPARRFASVHELVSTLGDVVRGKPFAGADSVPLTTAPMDGPTPPPELQALYRSSGRTQASAAVTVDPDDAPRIPTTSYGWVIAAVLFGFVLLAGGGYWLFARTGSAEASAETEPAPSVAAAANVETIRAPAEAPSASAGPAPPPPTTRPPMPRSLPEARAVAPQPQSEAEPQAVATAEPKAAAAEAAPPPVAKPPSQAPKALTCVSDPFTGGLRPAKRGEPGTLPCKQNPFTGGYQRL
jgi:serine/threonine-protein kinase